MPPEGLRLPAGERTTIPVTARATGVGTVSIEAHAVPIGDEGFSATPDGPGGARARGEMVVRPMTVFSRAHAIERMTPAWRRRSSVIRSSWKIESPSCLRTSGGPYRPKASER